MAIITPLLALAAVLANVHALSITPVGGEVLAHARRHAHVADSMGIDKKDLQMVSDLEAEDTLIQRKTQKVGLAWNTGKDSNLKHFVTPATKYMYTWSPWCPVQAKQTGLECCPMLWGWKQVGDFQNQKWNGGKCILGPNEPNEPSQSNMSPQSGAQIWNQYIRDMKHDGYLLVTPAVTSGDSGINWMKGFFASCGGSDWACGARVQAMHYYGTSSDDFKKWVNKFHDTFGLDIWITEMACQSFSGRAQCSQQDVWDFMGATTAWMTKTSWVKAYFYFGVNWDMYNVNPDNRLVNSNITPNDLGHFYLGGRN